MNPKEVKPLDGIIGPDPEEVEHFNGLRGLIPRPSRFAKGVAAVLGLGTAALAAEACARPTPPAEVRPIQPPAPTVPAKPKEFPPTPTPTFKPSPTPTETPKPVERPTELGWRRYAADLFEIDVPQQWEQSNQQSEDDDYYWFGSDERIPLAGGFDYVAAVEIKIGNKINQVPQEFADISLDELEIKARQAFQPDIQRGSFNSFSLKRVTIDGQQALDIAYYKSPSDPVPNGYERGLIFLRKGKAWSIVFKSHPSGQERMEQKFNKILSSFKFLESAKTLQPTPEKRIEQGWVKFRSLNYPYEINYPSGWTTGQQVLGGKKVDTFLGETVGQFPTNVNIFAEPVNPWVKLDDYQWQIAEQLNKLIFQTGRGVGVGGGRAKVAGQDAWILNARIPKGAVFFNPVYDILGAVFIARGQGWQITLSTDPSVTQVEQARFNQMLSSFKFLQ